MPIEIDLCSEDDVDSSDDDEADKAMIAAAEIRMANRAKLRAAKRSKTHGITFVFSLPLSKRDVLDKMEEPADCRLQQLLWELNCNFDLFPHQFLAVRRLAKVSADFPGEEMLSELTNKRDARLQALKSAQPWRDGDDHGVLLADSMGLGKTVQTVAAIRLQGAVAAARGLPTLPVLICSPNDAVSNQWKDHLVQGGVSNQRIVRFKPGQSDPIPKQDNIYICTRYDFMTEGRHVFENLPSKKRGEPNSLTGFESSPLFPAAPELTVRVLDNQYKHAKGRAKNKYKENIRGETMSHELVMTRYLKEALPETKESHQFVFRMLVIDEAVSTLADIGLVSDYLGTRTNSISFPPS